MSKKLYLNSREYLASMLKRAKRGNMMIDSGLNKLESARHFKKNKELIKTYIIKIKKYIRLYTILISKVNQQKNKILLYEGSHDITTDKVIRLLRNPNKTNLAENERIMNMIDNFTNNSKEFKTRYIYIRNKYLISLEYIKFKEDVQHNKMILQKRVKRKLTESELIKLENITLHQLKNKLEKRDKVEKKHKKVQDELDLGEPGFLDSYTILNKKEKKEKEEKPKFIFLKKYKYDSLNEKKVKSKNCFLPQKYENILDRVDKSN